MPKSPRVSFTVGIHLERNLSTPIYHQLDASLRRLILDGTLEPGRQLPSARELAKDLGISHITVKTVYEQIAAEGCVEAKTGAGIFVAQGLELEASREFKCISRKPSFPKVKLNERARTIMWRAGSQQCLSDSSFVSFAGFMYRCPDTSY